jgi:hypothetical protein
MPLHRLSTVRVPARGIIVTTKKGKEANLISPHAQIGQQPDHLPMSMCWRGILPGDGERSQNHNGTINNFRTAGLRNKRNTLADTTGRKKFSVMHPNTNKRSVMGGTKGEKQFLCLDNSMRMGIFLKL